MTALDAAEDAQCTWGVGADPVTGCDEYANGDDGLCPRHRLAVAGMESVGHLSDLTYDTETEQWGWECLVCPTIHAAVLTYAVADRMAEKHRAETRKP